MSGFLYFLAAIVFFAGGISILDALAGIGRGAGFGPLGDALLFTVFGGGGMLGLGAIVARLTDIRDGIVWATARMPDEPAERRGVAPAAQQATAAAPAEEAADHPNAERPSPEEFMRRMRQQARRG